jgi:para-nitrobenzyl esterase
VHGYSIRKGKRICAPGHQLLPRHAVWRGYLGGKPLHAAAEAQGVDKCVPGAMGSDSAPQNMENRYANKFASFRDHWNYGDVSEDCLRINVFTPALNDGKRPVLFWIHGGGFVNGNAIEQDGYNGENFARFGDVVFCSINHRLGPLGFCNLAGGGGEKFASSGNVGMLDIVAALEWVRDNIANFGGDAGNVTIMGQSGGGAKVCILTAMPCAKGLFHKAVVLSGAARKSGDKSYSEHWAPQWSKKRV